MHQLERQSSAFLFLRRIWALALRHIYLHIGSWPRIVEMLYWPMINMLAWGFTGLYIGKNIMGTSIAPNALVAGVLLSEIVLRVSVTLLLLFLEEVWSRNLGHLFASPIRFFDYVTGLVSVSFCRTALAIAPAIILATYLFGFSLFSLGWPLVAYIPLLAINGCWYGMLLIALLFRYGLAAEFVGWMGTWLLVPLIAPYYPVSILPHGLQMVAWAIPGTWVLESMKSQLAQQGWKPDYLLNALGLNLLYFIVTSMVLYRSYQGACRRGGLLQVGE
jgi:ABC-2 type transport system permease protein